MEETEQAPVFSKFRQGDILKLYRTSHANFGVIINADCDLANDKNDGHIAYLPLFTFKDFITRYWFKDEIKNITKQIENSLSRFLKTNSEVQELKIWLNHETADVVFHKLSQNLSLTKKEPEDLNKLIKKLSICLQENGLDTLREIYSLEKDPERHAETQLTKLKSNLGEGHMMISSIVGLPDLGFVLRMKRVFSIDQNYCFKSESEHLLKAADDSAIAAVRIARLSSTYKYKAAQIFANSFSRIGLSDELSKLSDLAILDIAQNLKDVNNV
jgi:hypothetical protein